MQLVSRAESATIGSSNAALDGDNNDPGKMFVGGLSWSTTEERMKEYFSKFGEVLECCIMQDSTSKKSRGFGFIKFADADAVDRVVDSNHPHLIDGKKVDPKRAVPKHQSKVVSKTKKVFLGGLPPDTHEDDIRAYFGQYGEIEEVMLMYDKNTQRLRGFAFVKFTKEESADDACREHYHEIKGKMCEAKKAQPKEVMSQMAAQKPNPNSGLIDPFPLFVRTQQSLMSYNPTAAGMTYPNAIMNSFQQFGAALNPLGLATMNPNYYPMLLSSLGNHAGAAPSPSLSNLSCLSSPPSKKALQSPGLAIPQNHFLYPADTTRAITPAGMSQQQHHQQKLTEIAMMTAANPQQLAMTSQTSQAIAIPSSKQLAHTPPAAVAGFQPGMGAGNIFEMYQNGILFNQLAQQSLQGTPSNGNIFTTDNSQALLAAFNGYQ